MTAQSESQWRQVARAPMPHDAFFFDSAESLAEIAGPFLLEGLDAGDAAVVATSEPTARIVQEAVGGDPRVHVLTGYDAYQRRAPGAITTFRQLAERRDPGSGGRVRVVGEVDFGPSERNWLEWERYEAVINSALAAWPLWGLCVFDTGRLAEPVLESALRTHPHLATTSGRRANPAFTEPAEYLRSLPIPEEPLEATPPLLAVSDVTSFRALRHAVATALAGVPAEREQTEDFLLAMDEMTSNAVRHGGPPVSLRLWRGEDRIVCTIADGGPGWDDPFAGYGPAHGEDLSRGGMGLWLARQLCDHVDISGDPARDGSVRVRLTTRLG